MSTAEYRTEEQGKAERYLHRAGYKAGGRISDKAQDAKMVAAGVHQHEAHLHRGEAKTALKLKGGGKVEGKEAKGRLDKYARGGRTKGAPSKINIVIATGRDQQQPQAVPVPVPKPVPVPAGPVAPAGMPPGLPPGAGAIPPRPPMKRGGAVIPTDAGSGSGMGRLEKEGMADRIKVKGYTRRRAGGRV